ncbi:MAG: glycosyltransferase family 39 protein [Nitrospinota bacterium]|nr:glycosyltransferase family 39 protein [Nitrospinota bacterium]
MDNASASATNNIPSFVKRWGRVSLIYIVLAAYFWSFCKYGLNIWDEGGYANGTLRTLNGERALVDFNPNGYLPGRYWYGMLFFKLFGVEIQSLRIGALLFTPPMVIMIYSMGRKIMPAGFALLAALFMLSAPSMYYNRFYTFFVILNLYCLTNVVEKRNLASLFGLGAAIFLSSFFKFEVTLFSILVSLGTLALLFSVKHWRVDFNFSPKQAASASPKPGKFYFLLAGVAAILFAVYLGKDGYFTKVFKLVVDAHEVWGNPFPEILPFFALLEKVGAHQMFERILFYLPPFTYGVVAILLFYQLVIKKETFHIAHLMVLAILLFGACAFGLVIWRAGFDNLLRTLPPFYLLLCYLLYGIREKILSLQKPVGQNGIFMRLPLNLLTVFLPFLFYFEMNTHHGFYAGSIGAMKLETTRLSLEKMDVYTNPGEAKWIKKVIDKINLHSKKGDAILALPLNPIFYFLSDRVNPTPYEWILPGMLEEKKERALVKLLKYRLPKIVIYVDIAIDGKEERRLSRYAPHLYKFLVEHYSFQEMVGFFQILLPKNPSLPLDF